MRFTKILFALISSLAVIATAQVTQPTPAAPAVPAQDDAALREALRKALEGETTPAAPRPATPIAPIAPAAPPAPIRPAPVTPIAPTPLPAVPLTTYSYVVTNLGISHTTSLALSVRDAIALALENNLEIRVFRYNPLIAEYARRELYGVYDPIFNGTVGRRKSDRENGGFNSLTGTSFPGTDSETDFATANLSGKLPSGMTYGLSHELNHVTAIGRPLLGINSFGEPVFGRSVSDNWDSRAAIEARQPFLRDFWIDNDRLSIKLARRDVQRNEVLFERQIMDVINRVEQAYYELVATRETVRVGEADVAVKKQFFDEQRRRVEVGILAALDEKLAQAELALSEKNLIESRRLAADAESILKSLIKDNYIGLIGTEIQLTDRLLAVPATLESFDAFREAMENRPDLQELRLVLEQAQLRLKYDYNQLFPRLDVVGTLGYNGLDRTVSGALQDIRDRSFQDSRLALELNFPLGMWKERNRRKADENRKAQAITDLNRAEEEIVRQVDEEVRLIRSLWAQIPYTREVTLARQAALEAEKKKLDAGKSTSFNVLNIASDLTSAQVEEIRAIVEYNKALAELNFRKGTTLQRWNIDRPARSHR